VWTTNRTRSSAERPIVIHRSVKTTSGAPIARHDEVRTAFLHLHAAPVRQVDRFPGERPRRLVIAHRGVYCGEIGHDARFDLARELATNLERADRLLDEERIPAAPFGDALGETTDRAMAAA